MKDQMNGASLGVNIIECNRFLTFEGFANFLLMKIQNMCRINLTAMLRWKKGTPIHLHRTTE